MKSKLYSLTALALAGCLLAGCGGTPGSSAQSGSSAGSSQASGEKISLDFWTTPAFDEDAFEAVIQDYAEEHNLDITVTWVPYDNVEEKINIALTSDTFPDVYQDGIQRLGKLCSTGVAADLTPYITEEWDIDDMNPVALQMGTVGDELRAVYTNLSYYPLILNRDLFEQAGAQLPDEETRSWTRAEFEEAMKKIRALGDDYYGFALGSVNMSQDKFIDQYIMSDGDSWVNETFDKLIYNSEKNVENFEWLLNMLNSDVALPGTAGNDVVMIFELFKQGNIGCMSWNGGFMQELDEMGMNYMIANYPSDNGECQYNMSGGGFVAKSQEDKEKEKAAAELVMWLSSPDNEAMNELYKASGLCARASLSGDPINEEWAALERLATKSVTSVYAIPAYSEIRPIWTKNFQAAIIGEKTAQQALDDFVNEASALM